MNDGLIAGMDSQGFRLSLLLVLCLIPGGKAIAQSQPLQPARAARQAILPPGFQMSVFAAEPDVRQPIAFCIDDRARLWVAEAYNYPDHGTRPGDRILILEDEDGDGEFDKRTVFCDKLNYVTGIEVGFGGAWVMSPPFFYFIADRNGDDRPDAEPEVLLDGFGNHANAHNLANGFSWGPDGWLYGTHGRTNWSLPGRPGTPDEERVQLDGGVYRYHPVRHEWEWFADGTTNPWGVDFDDYGQAFISNIGPRHLYHAIQGAHYEPWRNRKSSQYAYQRIPTIADHHHWPEVLRRGSRRDRDRRETGEDHAGVLVYLGDNWPDHYRNTVLMCNLHGRAINNDLLAFRGSGYTASHGPDFAQFTDPWFVGVTLRSGPDGAVFVSDWSENGECHFRSDTQRQTGRIYKISYGDLEPVAVDMARLSDEALVQAQLHKNDWHVRHARRILHERAAAGHDLSKARALLREMLNGNPDVTRKLRALWALHVTGSTGKSGGVEKSTLLELLEHESRHLRAWAIRLLSEREPSRVDDTVISAFSRLSRQDPSPYVRLHLASALRRLRLRDRWSIAEGLVGHAEDSADANLPLMVWYGIEPLVAYDMERTTRLLAATRISLVRQFIARRAVSGDRGAARLEQMVRFLSNTSDPKIQLDVVLAMRQALRGRRDMTPPSGWPELNRHLGQSEDQELALAALRLGLVMGDSDAIVQLREMAESSATPVGHRRAAVQDLVEQRVVRLAPLLHRLLDEPAMRDTALRGLAAYDHTDTARMILDQYRLLSAAEKQDAISTLVSRPENALALLRAVRDGTIRRQDVAAATIRQMAEMRDQRVSDRLQEIWGVVRTGNQDQAELISRYKALLTSTFLEEADLSHGRVVYERVCASCHTLFGEGKQIGPDLTGSNRANLDYILENILDPNALVETAYQLTMIQTADGRILSGLLVEETAETVVIQTPTDRIYLSLSDVESKKLVPTSMMPEGLLRDLSDREVRDLIGYLASPVQMD